MTALLTERGIIFSGDMVPPTLDGRKNQTRRLLKHQPPSNSYRFDGLYCAPDKKFHARLVDRVTGHILTQACPYGRPGDRLWVREAFHAYHWDEQRYVYRASVTEPCRVRTQIESYEIGKWTSPRFMPKRAARIWLEITGIRVERVQDISTPDCWAEGINGSHPDNVCPRCCYTTRDAEELMDHYFCEGPGPKTPREVYRDLWDSLNAKRAPWESNPWVWVIEFRRVKP